MEKIVTELDRCAKDRLQSYIKDAYGKDYTELQNWDIMLDIFKRFILQAVEDSIECTSPEIDIPEVTYDEDTEKILGLIESGYAKSVAFRIINNREPTQMDYKRLRNYE